MPDHARASAPGRVNLIGEHTDYHEGFVLPTVIPQRTHVALTARADRVVSATSAAWAGAHGEFELGQEKAGRGWIDYVQAVTAVLARTHPIGGFDAEIVSDVPVGAGVSSSAALTVGLIKALRELYSLPLDDLAVATTARAAETDFVGAPVGIMDQMVCALGEPGAALFIDTRDLSRASIPLPSSVELVVINSGVTHQHAGGEYKARRRESFDAAAQLGVAMLRDAVDASPADLARLPPLLQRRARHVISEHHRVLAAVSALRDGDLRALRELFAASQASMRDDYEITTPEIDRLVGLLDAHPAIVAARMTGGGFGGCVVALARRGQGGGAAADVCREYSTGSGPAGSVVVPAQER
jgi:galactokinase